jgi:hypothetical protein
MAKADVGAAGVDKQPLLVENKKVTTSRDDKGEGGASLRLVPGGGNC